MLLMQLQDCTLIRTFYFLTLFWSTIYYSLIRYQRDKGMHSLIDIGGDHSPTTQRTAYTGSAIIFFCRSKTAHNSTKFLIAQHPESLIYNDALHIRMVSSPLGRMSVESDYSSKRSGRVRVRTIYADHRPGLVSIFCRSAGPGPDPPWPNGSGQPNSGRVGVSWGRPGANLCNSCRR